MSIKLEEEEPNEKIKMIEKYNNENIFYFNKDTQFKLIIKNEHNFQKKINNDNDFLNFILSGENNTYIFDEISPKEVIQKIADNSVQKEIQNLISYNYYNIFKGSNLKINENEKNELFNSKIIKLNIVSPEKYSIKKGKVLLIKFNFTNQEKPFILDKNIIYNSYLCIIDKNNKEENTISNNDIYFIIEIKKLIKSIQIRLEELKQKGIKNINEDIFLPLFQPNIGVIISKNSSYKNLNLETMKTNFNSIVKRKFILKSIFISFNISLSLNNEILMPVNKNQNNFINYQENIEKISDSVNDEITSCCSSSYYSPKLSISEKDSQDNNINKNPPNFSKFNLYNTDENDNFNDNLNYNKTKLRKINSLDSNYINYEPHKFTNFIFKSKSNKKNFFNYKLNNPLFNENITFLDSSDIFSKTLFNRYQDKSNSTCNLKILMEFIKIKLNQALSELTLNNFFNSFFRIGLMSLRIPFFKVCGGIIEKTLTPSLKEIKLLIKNSKLIKKIKKKFSQKILTSNSSEENIMIDVEGFNIHISEKESLVKIIYNEERPYYLTESLNDKLEQLMNISKYMKKLNIEKNVIINKSYMSIKWNFINGNNLFSSSFISYYLFNSNLVGVLSDIKEKEYSFFLNSIEDRTSKNFNIDYRNIVYENNNNIFDFINSIN